MNIHEIKNFVSDNVCDLIVSEIPITPTIPMDKIFPFYAGRNRYMDDFPSKNVLKDILDKITNKSSEIFKHKLGVTYGDVVTWYTGQSMEPHCDTRSLITGFPSRGCENRDYTAILYLNDDFDGGKLYFPELLVSINPEKGKLVLFPSNIDYVHGISIISRGIRYSIPIWFHIIKNT